MNIKVQRGGHSPIDFIVINHLQNGDGWSKYLNLKFDRVECPQWMNLKSKCVAGFLGQWLMRNNYHWGAEIPIFTAFDNEIQDDHTIKSNKTIFG
jgi:hypothetical protein